MIALLLLALTPHLASAKEFHVTVNGNDQDQGSASEPPRTISVAAQVAQPGEVITVHAGVYPSPCRDSIPKPSSWKKARACICN